MEGHPGEGDTWAEPQTAADGGRMPHPALDPSKVPEGPLSCGCRNRFRGRSQNRNTWKTQSGFRPRTRCSEQSTDRFCSAERRRKTLVFFPFSPQAKHKQCGFSGATSAVNGRSASATCNPKNKKDTELHTVISQPPGQASPSGLPSHPRSSRPGPAQG